MIQRVGLAQALIHNPDVLIAVTTNAAQAAKKTTSTVPIVFMGVTSSTLPMWVLDDYAETLVAQRISTINGVAQVRVEGSQKYAVHVQVDPNKLAARQIGINEVEASLRAWNVNTPTALSSHSRSTMLNE